METEDKNDQLLEGGKSLKLTYPYKEYFIGLCITLSIIIYGSFVMYQIIVLEGNSIVFGILYLAIAGLNIYWYIPQLQKYKERYVMIENQSITIVNKEKKDVIHDKDLDCIIIAEHKQIFKIHHVIHIYSKDGRYFYITNELNDFRKMEEEIKKNFYDKILIPKKILNGSISKEFLLAQVKG